MGVTRRILIVDDSEIAREAAAFVLRSSGYEVFTIDSPFRLASALNEKHPDLVLIDVSMPALRGDTLIAVLQKNDVKPPPLVLYSDRPLSELRALAVASGAAGFIQKGGTNDLPERVEHYLQSTGT